MIMENLNQRFAIDDHLSFQTMAAGLPVAEINNSYASATVALLGSHLVTYRPHGQEPVVWVSEHSSFEEGQPIRGGVPVCWPWFATHPTDPAKPVHGLVRSMTWTVAGTAVIADGSSQIRLTLSDSEATRAHWPYPFAAETVITVGPELHVELIVGNPGDEPFSCQGALHTYFAVSDIGAVVIDGLDGCTYIDKVDAFKAKTQQGPVTIEAETDRIYVETTGPCVIEDAGWRRSIHVAKLGSQTTVIWNPWVSRAKQLPDMADEAYRRMICLETANAAQDVIMIPPGGEHRLKTMIRSEAP